MPDFNVTADQKLTHAPPKNDPLSRRDQDFFKRPTKSFPSHGYPNYFSNSENFIIRAIKLLTTQGGESDGASKESEKAL